MLEITTAPLGVAGGALPLPPELPKKKARPTTTPSEPYSNAATLPADDPDDKAFADTCASFARLGYELRRHRTATGLVHHLADEVDVPPRPTTGRTVFVVRNWNEGRHLASWHAVVGLLSSLQDARHATTTDRQ